MCMEDVRIGRKTMSRQHDFTATTTSQPLISGSDDRYAMILTAPLVGHVTYSLENPAVLGNGINLGVGDGAITISIQEHGDIVRRPWFIISDQAAAPIAVLSSHLLEK